MYIRQSQKSNQYITNQPLTKDDQMFTSKQVNLTTIAKADNVE